jgi:radical SAM protein with 4Fe4S-binding SPASM domain
LDESIQCFSGAEFKNCMAGDRKLTIDSFGNVFPCSFFTPFSEFNAGNLRKEKLVDIWKNSSVLSRLRNRKVCDECAFCSKYKKSCLAGCPAISFAALGNENALDPTCPFK